VREANALGARVDTAARWAAACVAFVLPFSGLAELELSELLSAAPISFAVAAAAPFLLAACLRNRGSLARSPLFLAVLAVALTRVVSGVAAFDGLADLRSLARNALFAVAVGGIGAVVADPVGRRLVERALVVGGLIAVAISAVGYALSFAVGAESFLAGFKFASDNNVIDGWPRLTGTSGGQPERMGEHLVLLAAVLLARRARAPGRTPAIERAGLPLSAAALALTFSWAWVGGLTLAAYRIRARLAQRPAAIRALPYAALAASALAMALVVNLGAPLRPGDPPISAAPVEFASFDFQHDVTVFDPAWGDRGRRVGISCPYEAPLKMYLEAKRAAIAVFADHPLLGVGEQRFGERAKADFAARHRLRPTELPGVYTEPHCTYLGAAAVSGIPGLAAVLFLVWAIARAGRRIGGRSPEAAAAGVYLAAVVGFLIIGINIDLLESRTFWLALALLLGAEVAARGRPNS
jgi:hypothetical protein